MGQSGLGSAGQQIGAQLLWPWEGSPVPRPPLPLLCTLSEPPARKRAAGCDNGEPLLREAPQAEEDRVCAAPKDQPETWWQKRKGCCGSGQITEGSYSKGVKVEADLCDQRGTICTARLSLDRS